MNWLAGVDFLLGGLAPLWRLQEGLGLTRWEPFSPAGLLPAPFKAKTQFLIWSSSPEFFHTGHSFLRCHGPFTDYVYVHSLIELGSKFVFFFSSNWTSQIIDGNVSFLPNTRGQYEFFQRVYFLAQWQNVVVVVVTTGRQTFVFSPANCASWFWPTGPIAVEGERPLWRQQEAGDGVLFFSGVH